MHYAGLPVLSSVVVKGSVMLTEMSCLLNSDTCGMLDISAKLVAHWVGLYYEYKLVLLVVSGRVLSYS